MKVSIIVPVYGVEQYLDKCVSSIVGQTYKNLEIFLVDDGSPDNCPQMCDEWAKKDERITVIHKENGGQGTARNAALDKITGDYLLFVDSDDYILPDMVEKLVANTHNGKIPAVFCGMILYDKIKTRKTNWHETTRIVSARELMGEYLIEGKIFGGPQCKLLRADIFEDIRFPSFRANEDAFVLHHILGKCNTAVLLNEWLYVMNLHEGSTEAKPFNPNKMHLLDCDYDLKEYIFKHFPEYQEQADFKLLTDAIFLLEKLYAGNEQKCYEEHEEKLWKIIFEEYQKLMQIYSRNPKLEYAKKILDAPEKFKLGKKRNRIISNIKITIKRILIKIINHKEML